MEFGVLAIPRDPAAFRAEARAAERGGFDFLGVPDSQSLVRELYISLGAAAAATETIALGPSVTNPVTRHPAVTASAICALDEQTGGRAVLGVASGDSAVYTLGERPATVAELREFVELVGALCRGERVDYRDRTIGLTWLRRRGDPRDVPVMLAAEGPRTLRLAGRLADRVLVGLGVTPDVVERAAEQIAAGARAADRDPADVETWVYARAAVVDDRVAVEAALEDAVAASAHHALQFTLAGKQVPDEHADAIRTLVREYDSAQHVGLGDEPVNRALVDRLGLTAYLTERFAIAGPPEAWIERIEGLQATGVVDGLHLHPVHDDPLEFIDRLAADVIPAV